MNINIRPAESEDYPALTDLCNAQTPFPATADRLLAADRWAATNDTHFRRLVAVHDNCITGSGEIRSAWGDAVQPGRFWISIQLEESTRSVDRFSQMMEALIYSVQAEVLELAACIRSDFLQHAGFVQVGRFEERFRSWGAHLDLPSFDPARFRPHLEALENEGFRFTPFAELAAPENVVRLRELQADVSRDVLSFEPIVPAGMENLLGEDYPPEGLIIAISPAGEYAGLTSLKTAHQADALDTGLTGVRRQFRGHGIATALKVQALDAARLLGATQIGTGGGGTDSPMKRLNQKLGFKIGPEWVTLISKR